MDYGAPISYVVLEPGTDIVCSEGNVVGEVQHVLADAEEDVFDGLVIDVRLGPGGSHFVDADQVLSDPASYLTLARGTPVVDCFGAPIGDRFEAAYEARSLAELQRLVPDED